MNQERRDGWTYGVGYFSGRKAAAETSGVYSSRDVCEDHAREMRRLLMKIHGPQNVGGYDLQNHKIPLHYPCVDEVGFRVITS